LEEIERWRVAQRMASSAWQAERRFQQNQIATGQI
jgi:hypothetical protein